MRSDGGASLAVKTLLATSKRGPAEHAMSVVPSLSDDDMFAFAAHFFPPGMRAVDWQGVLDACG